MMLPLVALMFAVGAGLVLAIGIAAANGLPIFGALPPKFIPAPPIRTTLSQPNDEGTRE